MERVAIIVVSLALVVSMLPRFVFRESHGSSPALN